MSPDSALWMVHDSRTILTKISQLLLGTHRSTTYVPNPSLTQTRQGEVDQLYQGIVTTPIPTSLVQSSSSVGRDSSLLEIIGNSISNDAQLSNPAAYARFKEVIRDAVRAYAVNSLDTLSNGTLISGRDLTSTADALAAMAVLKAYVDKAEPASSSMRTMQLNDQSSSTLEAPGESWLGWTSDGQAEINWDALDMAGYYSNVNLQLASGDTNRAYNAIAIVAMAMQELGMAVSPEFVAFRSQVASQDVNAAAIFESFRLGGSTLEVVVGDASDAHYEASLRGSTVLAGDGNDTLTGSIGVDNLVGGAGDDKLDSRLTDRLFVGDKLDGGAGYDRYFVKNKDVIVDSDGQGLITFEGRVLGGSPIENQAYTSYPLPPVVNSNYPYGQFTDGTFTYSLTTQGSLIVSNAFSGSSIEIKGVTLADLTQAGGWCGIQFSPSPYAGTPTSATTFENSTSTTTTSWSSGATVVTVNRAFTGDPVFGSGTSTTQTWNFPDGRQRRSEIIGNSSGLHRETVRFTELDGSYTENIIPESGQGTYKRFNSAGVLSFEKFASQTESGTYVLNADGTSTRQVQAWPSGTFTVTNRAASGEVIYQSAIELDGSGTGTLRDLDGHLNTWTRDNRGNRTVAVTDADGETLRTEYYGNAGDYSIKTFKADGAAEVASYVPGQSERLQTFDSHGVLTSDHSTSVSGVEHHETLWASGIRTIEDIASNGSSTSVVVLASGDQQIEAYSANGALTYDKTAYADGSSNGHAYTTNGQVTWAKDALGNSVQQGSPDNDALTGGTGDDAYLMSVDAGVDTILDQGGTGDYLQLAGASTDTTYLYQQGNDLVAEFYAGHTGKVTVRNWFASPSFQLETIAFDNKTLTAAELTNLTARFITDGPFSTELRSDGGLRPEWFTPNAGNDHVILGGTNKSRLFFGRLDGSDTVEMNGSDLQVRLTRGLQGDFSVSAVGPSDVQLTWATGERLRLNGLASPGYHGTFNILTTSNVNLTLNDVLNKLQPAGTSGNDILTVTSQTPNLQGLAGNDQLYGDARSQTLDGGDGDDLLVGAKGDDTLLGGAGDDTYRISRGDGADVIEDSAGAADQVVLTDISMQDTTAYRKGDDLVLDFGTGRDQLTLRNWNLGAQYQVESFSFAGQTLTASALDALAGRAFLGTANSDYLSTDWSDWQSQQPEVFRGGAGDDSIQTGPYRVATVLFNAGDGHDSININGATHVRVGTGLGDFTVQAGWAGSMRVLWGSGEELLLNGLSSAWSNPDFSLRLADGRSFDKTQLVNAISNVATEAGDALHANATATDLFGLGGNDELWGSAAGQTLSGGDGADQLYGNGGADTYIGGAGDDTLFADTANSGSTFVFGRNGGADTLYLSNSYAGKRDVLKLVDGLTSSDVVFTLDPQPWSADYKNLVVTVTETGARFVVNNFINPYDRNGAIDAIEFDNGSSMNYAQIRQQVEPSFDPAVKRGTAFNDWLVGSGEQNKLFGGDGDDILIGNSAGGELEGNAGNDTLNGSSANDIFRWRLGDGLDTVSGNGGEDVLELAGDAGSFSVHAKKVGQDLLVETGVNAGVKFQNWFGGYNQMSIKLPDGTVLTSQTITSQFHDASYETTFVHGDIAIGQAQAVLASLLPTTALARAAGDADNPFVNINAWLGYYKNQEWAASGTSEYGTTIYRADGCYWGVGSDSDSGDWQTYPNFADHLADFADLTSSVFQDADGNWRVAIERVTTATATQGSMQAMGIAQVIAQLGTTAYVNERQQNLVSPEVHDVALYEDPAVQTIAIASTSNTVEDLFARVSIMPVDTMFASFPASDELFGFESTDKTESMSAAVGQSPASGSSAATYTDAQGRTALLSYWQLVGNTAAVASAQSVQQPDATKVSTGYIVQADFPLEQSPLASAVAGLTKAYPMPYTALGQVSLDGSSLAVDYATRVTTMPVVLAANNEFRLLA